ncbi:MAG: phosphatase PAP2 family protein [Anaerolineaceae bacterium]|jgi:undecaprenyl-diphosphatase
MKNELYSDLLEKDFEYSGKLIIPESKKLLRSFLSIISHSCDSWYWLIGLFLLWALGDAVWKERAVLWAVGLVILAAFVLLIKFLVRRPRPEGEWGQIYRDTDPHSFPSGHAARAALIAVLIVKLTGGWLAIVVIMWAILVGWSRIALKLHYLSDVLIGWLIGVVSGLLASQYYPWFSQQLEFILKLFPR